MDLTTPARLLMPAASPGTYQALGMLLSSSLVLPELMPADAVSLAGSEFPVELIEADHLRWPSLLVSPHSTPTLQLAPQEWRLELEGIGWFRATGGERLEWQRWDDSVSDRDIRTFAVTSGLGALANASAAAPPGDSDKLMERIYRTGISVITQVVGLLRAEIFINFSIAYAPLCCQQIDEIQPEKALIPSQNRQTA